MSDADQLLEDYARWVDATFEPFDADVLRSGPVADLAPIAVGPNRAARRSPARLLAAAAIVVVVLAAGLVVLRRDRGADVVTSPQPPSSWTTYPSLPFTGRQLWAAPTVWTGTELVIVGGLVSGPMDSLTVQESPAFNPQTRTWRLLPAPPVAFGTGIVAAWTGTNIVVIGHAPNPAFSTTSNPVLVAQLDPRAASWHGSSTMPDMHMTNTKNPGVEIPFDPIDAFMVPPFVVVTSRSAIVNGYDPTADQWGSISTGGDVGGLTAAIAAPAAPTTVMTVSRSSDGTIRTATYQIPKHPTGATSQPSQTQPDAVGSMAEYGASQPAPPFFPRALVPTSAGVLALGPDDEVATWDRGNQLSWRTERSGPSAGHGWEVTVATGNGVALFGEITPPPAAEAQVSHGAIYDAPTNRWTAIPDLATNADAYWHGGAWAGTQLLIWGGGAPNTDPLNGHIQLAGWTQ